MKRLVGAVLLLAVISGCSVPTNQVSTGAPASAPTAGVAGEQKQLGVRIDLNTLQAKALGAKDRSVQSAGNSLDVKLSGIDDTDGDGKVDRIRYTVASAEGAKECERVLSDEEIALANADPAIVEAIRKNNFAMPQEYVDKLNQELQSSDDYQKFAAAQASNKYRVQLTPLALGCIFATAGVNGTVAIWCVAAGWAWWACLVGTLGLHTAIAVLGCLAL